MKSVILLFILSCVFTQFFESVVSIVYLFFFKKVIFIIIISIHSKLFKKI